MLSIIVVVKMNVYDLLEDISNISSIGGFAGDNDVLNALFYFLRKIDYKPFIKMSIENNTLKFTCIGHEPVHENDASINYFKLQINNDQIILPVYESDKSNVAKLICNEMRIKYYVVLSENNFGGDIKIFLTRLAATQYMHEISIQTGHSYSVKEINNISE